jgi:nitrogen fixation/metabolism regulation signal transduction histidine kinase
MALIPGGLVYAISFQFLQRSIDSWFEVRLDESLNRGYQARAQRAGAIR